jgi:hypothetical protein
VRGGAGPAGCLASLLGQASYVNFMPSSRGNRILAS